MEVFDINNNRRLRLTYCTTEVNYTDRHEALRGLFATAELLVESVLMLFIQNRQN